MRSRSPKPTSRCTRRQLDHHPNAMTLPRTSVPATDAASADVLLGRGRLRRHRGRSTAGERVIRPTTIAFRSAAELLALAAATGMSVSEVMMRHECASRAARTRSRERLLHLRDVMLDCEAKGMSRTGTLPGELRVRRRAKQWYLRLDAEDPHRIRASPRTG